MRENDGVGVHIEDVDGVVSINERLYLCQHQRPLKLVLRFISRCVFINLLAQLLFRKIKKLQANNEGYLSKIYSWKKLKTVLCSIFIFKVPKILPNSFGQTEYWYDTLDHSPEPSLGPASCVSKGGTPQ